MGKLQGWVEQGGVQILSGIPASQSGGSPVHTITDLLGPAVRSACDFPGADAAQKIANAAVQLASIGGTIDCRCLTGAQTFGSDPFAAMTGQITVLMGPATYSSSVNLNVPSNVNLLMLEGAVVSMNGGTTLTLSGGLEASSLSQHFAGAGSVVSGPASSVGVVYPQWWGAIADGATDNSTAIQNAINFAATGGKRLYFPAGIYSFATTLVFKNTVTYEGAARQTAPTLGTVLKYTGASDAIQVNNPINSSTPAFYTIQDLAISCTTRTAGKAAFADVGSTFASFVRVVFGGNDYGLILDQSEVIDITACDFETGSTGTAGLWLVNGAAHTPGASGYFTNRIHVSNCQFNGNAGNGVMDDGGTEHYFDNNNINGLAIGMRMASVFALTIVGNEFEVATVTEIAFKTTMGNGGGAQPCSTVVIVGNAFNLALSVPFITFDNNSCQNLTFSSNNLQGGSATFVNNVAGLAPNGGYFGLHNIQTGAGSANVGNNFNDTGAPVPYTVTWSTSGGTQPVLGNGVLNGEYTRMGGVVLVSITLVMGSTTTFGTGTFRFSIPFAPTSGANAMGVGQINNAAVLHPCSAIIQASTRIVLGAEGKPNSGVGATTFTWAASDTIFITITYPIAATT